MMELKIKAKNYAPGTMSFLDGFSGPRGNAGFTMKVDEEKAFQIIEKLLNDGRKIKNAVLGLDGDFSENASVIWKKNKRYNYLGYDSSIWAEPILLVVYEDGSNEVYECWKR